MKGIMLKDLYDNFRVGKNLASYIFGGGFIIILGLLIDTKFNFLWVTLITATIFSSCTIEYACEQDERANSARMIMSFPLSKSQIVAARYLLALCCTAVANLLTFLYLLYCVFLRHILSFGEAIEFWGIALSFSIFFSGLTHITYYLFGKKIATIIYIILFLIVGVTYSLFVVVLGLTDIFAVNRTILLIASFPVSLGFFGLSFLISRQIFKKKFS